MRNALTEQLIKAGLVDEKKAKHVSKAKQKQKRQGKGGQAAPTDETRREAQRVQDEKAARDRALNAQRKAEADRRAVEAQIRQLIETHRIDAEGDTRFHFTDGSKVRQLHVNEATATQLARGRLGIVRFGEGYAIVPAEAAGKIAARDAACLMLLNDPAQVAADEAAYAEHPIPDDMMW